MSQDNHCIWMSSAVFHQIPDNAIAVGNDTDGSSVYLGRAFTSGKLYLTKIIPNRGEAYIMIYGKEVQTTYYDVFCGTNVFWCNISEALDSSGDINKLAVEMRKRKNEPLYIGRINYGGSLWLGVVRRRILHATVFGIEMVFHDYEILQANNDGNCIKCYSSIKSTLCNSVHSTAEEQLNFNEISSASNDSWKVIKTTELGFTDFPINSVYARSNCNDFTLFIARARHKGKVFPAIVIPSEDRAFIYQNNQRIFVETVEVLTGTQYGWIECNSSHIPVGAVISGFSDTKNMFIYRNDYVLCTTEDKSRNEILVNVNKYMYLNSLRENSEQQVATPVVEFALNTSTSASTSSSATATATRTIGDSPGTKEVLTCKVCLQNRVEVILLPCYHSILCRSCCKMIMARDKKCPYCRKLIISHPKVFY